MEPWIWAIIVAAFLIVEFVSLEMISVWFALGSLVGMILSFIPGVDVWVQILVAVVVSLAALFGVRSAVKKWLDVKTTNTNIDAMMEKETMLITAITGTQSGTIKLGDVTWTAVSNKTIAAGKKVKIVHVEGNKMFVEEVKEEQPVAAVEVKEQPAPQVKKKTEPKTTTASKTTTKSKTTTPSQKKSSKKEIK